MKTPEIAENVFTAPDAVILGDVQIEEECSIWFHAVVRAGGGEHPYRPRQ